MNARRRQLKRQAAEKRHAAKRAAKRQRHAQRLAHAARFRDDLRRQGLVGLTTTLLREGDQASSSRLRTALRLPTRCDSWAGWTSEERARLFRLAQLADAVRRTRLVDRRFDAAIWSLTGMRWVRDLSSWQPPGRSWDAQWRSLVCHLLAKYPVANFLCDVFFGWGTRLAADASLFERIATGGSLYDVVRSGQLLIPTMTRRMCHIFLETRDRLTVVKAVRRAQVLAYGGREMLAHQIGDTLLGYRFQGEAEPFWAAVLQWLCRRASLSANQLDALIDYLDDRHDEDPAFDLTGRSAASVMRTVASWATERRERQKLPNERFTPSGFTEHEWEVDGQLWGMREVSSLRDLHAEGRALRHCVFTYAAQVRRGTSVIWSLRCHGARRLTIEVQPRYQRLAQAKGKKNRAPKTAERAILRRWAEMNHLAMAPWI